MKPVAGIRRLARPIATLFGAGYSPVAPGTIASLLAIPVYLAIRTSGIAYIGFTVFVLLAGFWSSAVAEKSFTRKDPPEIVIDEFASMFVVYLFIYPDTKLLIIGFILFRILDIFKIPPIKKLQKLPGGFGIMLDDIASAILANLVLQILRFFPL